MRWLGLTVLCLGGLTFSGCKKESPLVGTWETESNLMSVPLRSVLTFNADGSFKDVTTSGNTSQSKVTLTATDVGTWKLEDNKLTTKVTSVDWQFTGSNTALIQRAQDRFNHNKEQILASANEHPTETITWKGNDEFSYTHEKVTAVFHRK